MSGTISTPASSIGSSVQTPAHPRGGPGPEKPIIAGGPVDCWFSNSMLLPAPVSPCRDQGWPIDGEILAVMGRDVGAELGRHHVYVDAPSHPPFNGRHPRCAGFNRCARLY